MGGQSRRFNRAGGILGLAVGACNGWIRSNHALTSCAQNPLFSNFSGPEVSMLNNPKQRSEKAITNLAKIDSRPLMEVFSHLEPKLFPTPNRQSRRAYQRLVYRVVLPYLTMEQATFGLSGFTSIFLSFGVTTRSISSIGIAPKRTSFPNT